MAGGTQTFLAAAAVALGGCASDSGELDIRTVADPLTRALRPGNPIVAEARGLLALGNVGLAIEAYRKVLREDPGSIEALAGLAECYDRMGRHDLSRAKYEAALAIAPKNPILLRTFAASLERQGRTAAVKALRAEADSAESADVAALADPAPIRAGPIEARAALRAAPAATTAQAVPVSASPAPRPTEQPAYPTAIGAVTVRLPPAPAPKPESPARAAEAASITVKIPPAAPAQSVTAKIPPPAPAQTAPAKLTSVRGAEPQVPAEPVRLRPRLERLSLGEVALVTSPQPRWKTEVIHRTALSTTVRFVPLAPARRDSGLRLLNAARHQGLAARTRIVLARKGWNRVSIGDSPRVRQRSLVLYSSATAQAARRIASDFGFLIAKDARPGPLTILLGRDAVERTRFRS